MGGVFAVTRKRYADGFFLFFGGEIILNFLMVFDLPVNEGIWLICDRVWRLSADLLWCGVYFSRSDDGSGELPWAALVSVGSGWLMPPVMRSIAVNHLFVS